jgi:amino acid transporter
MFTEVPRGTFPDRLIQQDSEGTHRSALWAQAAVVSVLILLPLASILTATNSSEKFLSLLNDLTALTLVVPYMFIAVAYIRARLSGMDAPFKMVRSTVLAVAIAGMVLVVSSVGYVAAGLYALQSDPVDWIYVAIVYGGPMVMIGLGMLLRFVSMKISAAA